MKKYMCISSETIKAEWLPRWYKVPHDECMFVTFEKQKRLQRIADLSGSRLDYKKSSLFVLTPRPNKDYEEHLKILKTERLLNG